MVDEQTRHHIWCNFSAAGPVEDCKQCKRLFEQYPPDGDQEDMATKHFPDAVKIEQSNG